MDYVRACYTIQMQFDAAGDIVRPITWYFAEEDAELFDGPHLWGSSVTWQEHQLPSLDLGERWDSKPVFTQGDAPFYAPGNGSFCGKKEWYSQGCPSDAPPVEYSALGVPACCPQPLCAPWFGGATAPSVVAQTGYTVPFHLFIYDPSEVAVFLSDDFNTPMSIGPGTGSCGTKSAVTGSININNVEFFPFALESYDPVNYLAKFVAAPGYTAPPGFSVTFLIPP